MISDHSKEKEKERENARNVWLRILKEQDEEREKEEREEREEKEMNERENLIALNVQVNITLF